MTDIEKRVIGDALWWSYYDDCGPAVRHWVRHPVTLITEKRVYFEDHGRRKYCDRAKLEARGWVAVGGVLLHLDGPEEHARREEEQRAAWVASKADEVARLRQEAAAAHPDRGGTDESFIEANARYQRAKTAQRRRAG